MKKKITICYYNDWADGLYSYHDYKSIYLTGVEAKISGSNERELLIKGQRDCEWNFEVFKCFSKIYHEYFEFEKSYVVGTRNLLDYIELNSTISEERWIIFSAQNPAILEHKVGEIFQLFKKSGLKILYYSFDDASRKMNHYKELAPYLDILIHDEFPLANIVENKLSNKCLIMHKSWVANVVPWSVTYNEKPIQSVLFLGSTNGLTKERSDQLLYLKDIFKDKFVCSTDHSVSFLDREKLNKYKVSLCPEGRHFKTASMSSSHTDRPFWSGCFGMVPVVENSTHGDRLNELNKRGLLVRYSNNNLNALIEACEAALNTNDQKRRQMYECYNGEYTIGKVICEALQKYYDLN